MKRQYSHFANINFAIIFRILGWLLMIEAVFMSIALLTSIMCHEDSIHGLALSVIITGVTGCATTFGLRPRRNEMGKREAIMLTSLVWVIFSIFGMLPFVFCNPHLDILEAYFEAVSGFTTTGATMIIDVEAVPKGILMWRAIMQWLGGMGIILFTLAVLPMLNHQGGIQLFNAEVSGITHDKLRPRISQTAKSLWLVYIILTITEFGLLILGPMDWVDAICQTLSTVATGGFCTKNAGISTWDSRYVEIVILIFMFLGGINFQLLYRAGTGNFRALFLNDTFRWYCIIIFVSFILITISVVIGNVYDTAYEYCMYPLFQIVAAVSSTGFFLADFELWGPFTVIMFMVLMVFGGCAGSTTSGAKIDRLIMLLKNTRNEFYRIIHPNTVTAVRVNGKYVAPEAVSKIIAFLAIYMMILVVCSIILSLCGYDFSESVFASISCLSNMGYGVGVTGIQGSFFNIIGIGKVTLIFAMIVGRLELFTFLVIFTKYFWTK
ncbi:MAG: TrkH family potassium uptake protein [Muribaculaceae bacterium]|nr:TrkH family potassium uptake protein [Muribaculaceae bacterium]